MAGGGADRTHTLIKVTILCGHTLLCPKTDYCNKYNNNEEILKYCEKYQYVIEVQSKQRLLEKWGQETC